MIKAQMYDQFGNPIDDDVVPPGGSVRVPMQLRDSAMRGVVDHAAANLASGQRTAAAMAADAAEVRRHLDGLNGEARARQAMIDRDPRAKAYAQSCEALQYGRTGGAR